MDSRDFYIEQVCPYLVPLLLQNPVRNNASPEGKAQAKYADDDERERAYLIVVGFEQTPKLVDDLTCPVRFLE